VPQELRQLLIDLAKTPDRWAAACYKQDGAKKTGHYSGKVREVTDLGNGTLEMLQSDRLSAFDRYICDVPYKGVLLTDISDFWFTDLQIPHHYIRREDLRTILVKKTQPIKVEVVVRGYLAGSLLRQRAHLTGIPSSLPAYAPLPEPWITPTTKAAAFEHDEEISTAAIVERGICSQKIWDTCVEYALALFTHGQKTMRDRGLILADTKYEFGIDSAGKVIVIDEIHTPDSSRFWRLATYDERLRAGKPPEMSDKEIIRQILLQRGFSGQGDVPQLATSDFLQMSLAYLDIAETLRGTKIIV
jgi:phosphoribosylaminoimidazole-succinocarboxamide synthase